MTPIPAEEATAYKGSPLSLGAMQHHTEFAPQELVDPSLLQAYLKAGSAMLLSVFPLKRYSVLPYAGQMTIEIPAAVKDKITIRRMEPKRMASAVQDISVPLWNDETRPVARGDGFVALQVTDTFQWILDIHHRGSKHHYVPMLIEAQKVAEALVEEWLRGLATSTGKAGIGIYDPGSGLSMEDQAAQLRQIQEQAFIEKIRQADIAHGANRLNEITDFHRVAAEWMGVERPWFKPIFEVVTKFCPGCTERIPQGSKRCRYCQLDLVEWYQRQYRDHARIEELDPAVYAHLVDTGKIVTKKT